MNDIKKLTGIEGIIEDNKIVTVCEYVGLGKQRPKYCAYGAFYENIECPYLHSKEGYCKHNITKDSPEVRLYDERKLHY